MYENEEPMTPEEIMQAYFDTWKRKDFLAYRSLLADSVTFHGPMGEAHNADEAVAGIKKMSEIIEGIVINKMLADDADVITWFELHAKNGVVTSVANWSYIENGKITKILVTFDPRPLFS